MLPSFVLAGAMAAAAMAQTVTSPPFHLKLQSTTNETLNGSYLYACHAGAAIEGLCLGSKTASTSASSYFVLNQTQYNNNLSPTGNLIWGLPLNGENGTTVEQEILTFNLGNLGSNVVVPLFYPGYGTGTALGFDEQSKLYIATTFDDSSIVAGQYPNVTSSSSKLYNWNICWAATGGYYYYALAWVTTGTPTNPTCESVTVVREA